MPTSRARFLKKGEDAPLLRQVAGATGVGITMRTGTSRNRIQGK
jgi:hypothetical protein